MNKFYPYNLFLCINIAINIFLDVLLKIKHSCQGLSTENFFDDTEIFHLNQDNFHLKKLDDNFVVISDI